MDLLSELPVAGQWTVLGILVGLLVFVVLQIFRGELVPRKQVDQVQKIADTYQRAWENSQQTNVTLSVTLEQFTGLVARMEPLAETMEHVLESLPKPPEEAGK